MMNHALIIGSLFLPIAADAPAADANAQDLAKMQGDWIVVSMTVDGMRVGDDDAQSLFRNVAGSKFTVFRYAKLRSKGTFKIDATKKPKTIDSIPAGPPGKVKPILGIYEFDGANLKICNATPGMPRPTDFEAKADSGCTTIVWTLEKKQP